MFVCVSARAPARVRVSADGNDLSYTYTRAQTYTYVTYITDKTDIRQNFVPHCTCMAMLMSECRECVNRVV